MNLLVDIGNTQTKLAVTDKNEFIYLQTCKKEDGLKVQQQILRKFPEIKNGILANVGSSAVDTEGFFSSLSGTRIQLSTQTPVPYKNLYESPETLGIDRIALAAAAVYTYPRQNVLVVDCGTCITYDLVTEQQEYLGGAISPGLQMRYKSLNRFTANLPLLSAKEEEILPIGKTTEQSMHVGVKKGMGLEIDGFIAHYQQILSNLTVVLTGGDHETLSKCIKKPIFVAKNFLLTGLNCILAYNISND